MSQTVTATARYLRKDGTRAESPIELEQHPDGSYSNTYTWTAPADCAALLGVILPDGTSTGIDLGWCEEDDGPRKCCSTRQLGPHSGNCPSPAKQDAMRDHELMYRHKTEVAGARG